MNVNFLCYDGNFSVFLFQFLVQIYKQISFIHSKSNQQTRDGQKYWTSSNVAYEFLIIQQFFSSKDSKPYQKYSNLSDSHKSSKIYFQSKIFNFISSITVFDFVFFHVVLARRFVLHWKNNFATHNF